MHPQNTEQIKKAFASLKNKPGWDVEKAREEFRWFDIVLKNGLRQRTPIRLDLCRPETIIDCVLEVASLNLSLNPIKKQAYLIPYRDVCTLLVGYQGEIDFLASQGAITHANVGAVRENDIFDFQNSEEGPAWKHSKPRKGKRGAIEGAFCVFHLPSGKRKGDYFTDEEIQKRKNVAKSAKFWNAWEDEMYIKTAVRMARAGLPKSQAIQRLEQIDNMHSDLDREHIEPERFELIKSSFLEANNKIGLISAYNKLPSYEQKNPQVMEEYDKAEMILRDKIQQ